MGPNRYVCSVLEEMRELLKKLDKHSIGRYKSVQAMMIEEAQTMVNRMEASLYDKSDISKATEKRAELQREVRKLKSDLKLLKEAKGEKEEEPKSIVERLSITHPEFDFGDDDD